MGKFQEMMLNTLKIHGYSERTQKTYLDHMRPPDQLDESDIYAYQVHLVNYKNANWSTFNIAVSAIKFFYRKALNKEWIIKHIPYQKKDLNYLPY